MNGPGALLLAVRFSISSKISSVTLYVFCCALLQYSFSSNESHSACVLYSLSVPYIPSQYDLMLSLVGFSLISMFSSILNLR